MSVEAIPVAALTVEYPSIHVAQDYCCILTQRQPLCWKGCLISSDAGKRRKGITFQQSFIQTFTVHHSKQTDIKALSSLGWRLTEFNREKTQFQRVIVFFDQIASRRRIVMLIFVFG